MNRLLGSLLLLALAGGCSAPARQDAAASRDEGLLVSAQPATGRELAEPLLAAEISSDRIVARVNGKPITMAELQKPLIEAYGLRVLLLQTQLALARQKAAEQNITVAENDIKSELNRTLKSVFKGTDTTSEDYPALLQQLLDNQKMSRAEFDIILETNAILRKIAEPQLKGRITEDNIKEAFNSVYGQTVVIRHIQCANPQEAQQAKLRAAAGEKFEDVARAMSRNPRTAPLGGELPPFSRQSTTWGPGLGKIPETFKEWAFSVKAGEISDPIQGESAYHILKLERMIAPKAVKFEDVKESLRADLEERLAEKAMGDLRTKLALMVRKAMVIEEPTLRRQYEDKIAQQDKAIRDQQQIQDEIRRAATRRSPTTQKSPATAPATLPSGTLPPADSGNASPANAPTGERPPATRSAEPPADKK